NDKGQVIGINSMKISSSYSSSSGAAIEGLGFAIPINEAQEIVNDLMNNGYVTGRPQLGITCQDVTSAQNSLSGVYVVGVNENGAADKAGLQAGDVIVGVNGQQVSTITELNRIKNEFKAGDTLKLTVIRENKYTEINVVLEESVVMTENTPEEQPSEESAPENNPAPEENATEDDYSYGGNSPFDMFPGFGFDFPF
ncbi:MAG: S1C family serine protease, partial [Oscillospiraceae bacterium]